MINIRQVMMILALTTMTGCALTNPLGLLSPDKPSVEVSTNIGKNVESEKNNIKLETGDTVKQEAEEISNDTEYTADVVNQITNSLTPLQLLLLVICAGFAVPSYKEVANGTKGTLVELYSGLKVLTTDLLSGIVVTPIKGIANFLLTIFGRDKL